jgi:hypothetical protein
VTAFPWLTGLIASVFASVTLWDFYIGEIRLFDFAAVLSVVLVVASMAIMGFGAPKLERRSLIASCLIFALVFAYIAIGIYSHPDNLKPAVGILLGVVVFTFSRSLVIDEKAIDRAVCCVAWLHLSAFFFQLVVFYISKQIINFHAVVGLTPRLLSSVFRPAGLFLEPAIYCFFAGSIFMLRRQRAQCFRYVDGLLLLSMVISLSLWGISVALLLIAMFRTRFSLFLGAGAGFIATFALDMQDLSSSPIYRFFESRLFDLGSDSSARGRYGGTLDWIVSLLANPTVLFGNGINNFFEVHGSNGWAFVLNSFGLLGTFVLLGVFALMTRPRQWLLFFVGISVLLTAAPLWKTFYFWVWIALMLRPPNVAANSILDLRKRMI